MDPQFSQQVNWELDALEVADWIVVYFDPDTQSPISMLELGLHAKSDKVIVCCPMDSGEKEMSILYVLNITYHRQKI